MKRSFPLAFLVVLSFIPFACSAPDEEPASKPNVILIITDDQGYNDVGAHGNTMIQTPHLDALHDESVRLTNFHVDPTCSPTRSALMTGRYSTRTGVWHTIMGRSLIDPDEITLAEIFKNNGYATGMVGKWHLGDNYPTRPQDQGFDEVVWHKAGGVGQGADYWATIILMIPTGAAINLNLSRDTARCVVQGSLVLHRATSGRPIFPVPLYQCTARPLFG